MNTIASLFKMARWVGPLTLGMLIAGSVAQTTLPAVDLSLGPLAVNSQATNVALALSVEFPTVGAAYRNGTYAHSTTYLGYWDSTGCYDYKDTASGAPLSGEYFYRTGNVDTSGYCNTVGAGTGYSGNVLNYAATSSIDLLRYALTGGDRVADTADTTVLGRAFLRSGWLYNASNFPAKRIPSALEGLVTPDYADGSGDVVVGSCDDKIQFSRATTGVTCGTPAPLNKQVPNTSTLTVARVPYGTPPPSGLMGMTLGTVTWEVSSPLVTSTVVPSAGPTTDTFTYYVSQPGTTTTVPPSGQGLSTAVVSVTYTASGTSNTPTIGAPNTSVQTYTTSTTNRFDTNNPGPTTAATVTNVARSRALTLTQNSHRNVYVCNATAGGRLVGALSGGAPTNIASCAPSGMPSYAASATSLTTRRYVRNAVSPTWPNSTGSGSKTVYELYNTTPVYIRYTTTNNYQNFSQETGYNVYTQWQYYSYYTGTTPTAMYARVRVCDSTETATRTDLCVIQPNGNYKPVGEVQKRAQSLRIAAFGYLMDNVRTRYGGVLRAPMHFTGPTYRDTTGNMQTNPAPEWDDLTGVFITDPLGASPTFPRSGVINYLNKFGSTGNYKTYDPVGELYYEVLRYFQGLPPTASADSGLTSGSPLYDNFPVYNSSNWVDPVQNACQRRNYALVIGDVNTHNDRQLPGHGSGVSSGMITAEDPARAAEPLLGDNSKLFNAIDWTTLVSGFETGASLSYTDALGRAQTTAGNPSPNASNNNLASKNTGATNAAYYWAGAAYWANTQPIRLDTKNGESMKDIRVKTFTIDVDEYGNGSYVPTRSYALAGKYGWFNDANLDGNPFKTSGGLVNNTEWEDSGSPGIPEGYVIASQPQKMMEGIRKFFSSVVSEKGAVSVSSLSSQRFTTRTPNGDLYAPRFDSRDWSGTVIKSALRLNTSTGSVEATQGVTWDSGGILTQGSTGSQAAPLAAPLIRPVDRKVFSYARDTGFGTGVVFSAANFAALDTATQAALNTNPATGSADGNGTLRVNYMRGDRSNEQVAGVGLFRRRNSTMGDIINSGPVYKSHPNTGLSDAGYGTFYQTWANRTGTVYVGANDGMLHAFRETDGFELFAYVPGAIGSKLNKLTNPAYVHDAFVDGIAMVDEAKIGADWKTVLVSGMGGGAQGVFALDVTDPENFSASKVLFEFTDKDDPMMGNVVTQPHLVKIKVAGGTMKWFVAVGSGYNNYVSDGYATPSGDQALFLLSLDKAAGVAWSEGTNYFKLSVPAASTSIANGLGNTGVARGFEGDAVAMYAGDLQGQLWKFIFDEELTSTNIAANKFIKTSSGTKKPLFIASTPSNGVQPITITPLIASAPREGVMVVFGTGKFVEQTDPDNIDVQSVYSVWDNQGSNNADYALGKSSLQQLSATVGSTSVAMSTSSFALGTGSGQTRGCYWNLPTARERIAVEGAVGLTAVAIASTIPTGTCSGDGEGRLYEFNPAKCAILSEISTNNQIGFISRPNYIDAVTDPDGTYSKRTVRGKRLTSINEGVLLTGTKVTDAGNVGSVTRSTGSGSGMVTFEGGLVSWRELRDFRN